MSTQRAIIQYGQDRSCVGVVIFLLIFFCWSDQKSAESFLDYAEHAEMALYKLVQLVLNFEGLD